MKLENLVIHRESLRQMSKEQIRELNTQHGWFSNNIDDFIKSLQKFIEVIQASTE